MPLPALATEQESPLSEQEKGAQSKARYSFLQAFQGFILLPLMLLLVIGGGTALAKAIDLGQSAGILLSSVSFLFAALLYTVVIGKARDMLGFLKLRSFSFSHVAIGVATGLATYLLVVLVAIVAFSINEAVGGSTEAAKNNTTQLIGEISKNQSVFFAAFLVAILAPIAEEIFFRGAMLSSLVQRSAKKWLRVLAVVLISVVFGLLHAQPSTGTLTDVMAMLTPGIVGVVAALLTLKFNSLYPAIFAHLSYNGIVLLIIVTG